MISKRGTSHCVMNSDFNICKNYVIPRFTVNEGYAEEVLPFSKISLVCPTPVTITTRLQYNPHKEHLYENIWVVDKHSYDNCTIDTSRPSNRLLLRCDDPLSLRYYTIVFQMYSATLHGLVFKPGKTYYFICEYKQIALQRSVFNA